MKHVISCIVGRRIRQIRTSQGKSMTALAHDSDMEYIQLSRIERGQINTTLFQLFKISKALNISLDELFKGVDEEVIFELNQKSTF